MFHALLQKKCELYWPENTNEKRFFGDIIVEVKAVSFPQDYALREIEIHLVSIIVKNDHFMELFIIFTVPTPFL